MSRVDSDFSARVYDYVSKIPHGRLVTYGQIAAGCGAAWAAWEVGQIAHTGPETPWQRVVNKQGGLASGYPGGKGVHRKALELEGIIVDDEYQVNLGDYIWHPEQ